MFHQAEKTGKMYRVEKKEKEVTDREGTEELCAKRSTYIADSINADKEGAAISVKRKSKGKGRKGED